MNLFEKLEAAAASGAEGLSGDARAAVSAALAGLLRPGGGFAGLDGRADAYYSFFAWLGLRALGACYDRDGLCAYMRACRRSSRPVDALCAEILLAGEGGSARLAWLRWVGALVRGDARGMYGAFLLLLAAGDVPRWLARLAWRRQRRFAAAAAGQLPTPRLAAGLVLATLAGAPDARLLEVLERRRCSCGGFAAAEGAPADLLATAVARFAAGVARDGAPEARERNERDLAFVEACWLEDGLFGASPAAGQGDAEHTFYALLALGACRPRQAGDGE